MKRLINFRNKDNECCKWCLVRYLNLVIKNLAKIRNVQKEFAKQVDSKGVEFPFYKKDYAKIVKENNFLINVFGYEHETPYHIQTAKQTFEKHVDSILALNSKTSHYVSVKKFKRFMTNKTKHHSKKHFGQYCLQCFSSSEILEFHVKLQLIIQNQF